jgi:hypothetical protein
VFVTAIGIVFGALTATLLVRSPLAVALDDKDGKGKAAVRRRRNNEEGGGDEEEEERGRSRVSKDLRGYGYGSMSEGEAGSPTEQGQEQGPSGSGRN